MQKCNRIFRFFFFNGNRSDNKRNKIIVVRYSQNGKFVKLNKEKEKLKIGNLIAHLRQESFHMIHDSWNSAQNWRRSTTVHEKSDGELNNI